MGIFDGYGFGDTPQGGLIERIIAQLGTQGQYQPSQGFGSSPMDANAAMPAQQNAPIAVGDYMMPRIGGGFQQNVQPAPQGNPNYPYSAPQEGVSRCDGGDQQAARFGCKAGRCLELRRIECDGLASARGRRCDGIFCNWQHRATRDPALMGSWLDAIERRAREAIGTLAEPVPAPRIAKSAGPKPEIKTVWVQTARPRNGDAGAAEPGFYSVADGVVTMHDMDGKPTGKSSELGPNDDPQQVAHAMARDAWLSTRGETNFNRRLHYQTEGLA